MELLTVVAIVGVLVAIAVPSFIHEIPKYRLKRAGNELYGNMQRAKLGAVKENHDWAIVFDTGTTPGRYAVCSNDGADGSWDGGFTGAMDDNVVLVVNLAEYGSEVDFGHGDATTPKGTGFGDEVTFAGNRAVFNPSGFIDPPSGYSYLENKNGDTYCIGGLTSGVVRIYQWVNGGWI